MTSKENTISVLFIQPGKKPSVVEIGRDLESLQKAVGGYIEQLMPFEDEDIAIVCDEEGKLKGCDLNRAVYDENNEMFDIIAGDFLVCYAPPDSEHYESLPPELAKKYEEKFKNPEMFLRSGGEIKAVPYRTNVVSTLEKSAEDREASDDIAR